jgi:hypothetical protein
MVGPIFYIVMLGLLLTTDTLKDSVPEQERDKAFFMISRTKREIQVAATR